MHINTDQIIDAEIVDETPATQKPKNTRRLAMLLAITFLGGIVATILCQNLFSSDPAPEPNKSVLIAPMNGFVAPDTVPADTCSAFDASSAELRQGGTVTIGNIQVSTTWTQETVNVTVADTSGGQKTTEDIRAIIVEGKDGVLSGAKLTDDEMRAYRLVMIVSDWGSMGKVYACL